MSAYPGFYHLDNRLERKHEGKRCRRCGAELDDPKDRELGLCRACRELLHGKATRRPVDLDHSPILLIAFPEFPSTTRLILLPL
jgi:hypothetical protein